jgi:hypothetical protein
MLDDRKLTPGMKVMISKDCLYSKMVGFEFWQERKINMMGTRRTIGTIVNMGDRLKVIIDDWFFDSRDLTILISDDQFSNTELIENNKNEEKPKVFFNPEQL